MSQNKRTQIRNCDFIFYALFVRVRDTKKNQWYACERLEMTLNGGNLGGLVF